MDIVNFYERELEAKRDFQSLKEIFDDIFLSKKAKADIWEKIRAKIDQERG